MTRVVERVKSVSQGTTEPSESVTGSTTLDCEIVFFVLEWPAGSHLLSLEKIRLYLLVWRKATVAAGVS